MTAERDQLQTVDALRLQGMVENYRSMAPPRLLVAAGLTVILGFTMGAGMTLGFGVPHLFLYVALFVCVEAAARTKNPTLGLRKLAWRTGVLVCLISAHCCWLAILVRQSANPTVRTEAALLVIGVMVFTALQRHMTRRGYVAAVLPPVVTLLWFALNRGSNNDYDFHMLIAMSVFVIAVLSATFRQQTTDHNLTEAQLNLIAKNAALEALVTEADAARTAAEAANRAKSDFLAVTSHEIRTPLNAVLGLAEALKRERLSRRQGALAQGVIDAGALLKRLLNAMLDISKIEAGKMALETAPFDLRRTAETTVRVWGAKARERGISLTFEDGLPDACWIRADESKVEQTLVNLVSNALKFTPAGGNVVVRLGAESVCGDLLVRTAVLDDGPGVALDDRERIFQAFEQTDLGRASGGAGLGLAICAGNVALMGGQMIVGEAPGGGAAFSFSFIAPVAEAVLDESVSGQEMALELGRPLRILAAEDNAANRQVLRALIEPLPVALTIVENGREAVDALQIHAFDLVLMDARMPVMDGLEALRLIRAGEARMAATPVWMLTANVFDEDVARYSAAGADGVVKKPIDIEELFAAIMEAGARAGALESKAA